MVRPRVQLVPLIDIDEFRSRLFLTENLTLRELLQQAPALCTTRLNTDLLDQAVDDFTVDVISPDTAGQVYLPPGLKVRPIVRDEINATESRGDHAPLGGENSPAAPESLGPEATDFPQAISEEDAVRMTYAEYIKDAASYLHANLSVLIMCDKLVVDHLSRAIARHALLHPVVLSVPSEDEESGGLMMPRGLRQRQLAHLKRLIHALKQGDVLIIPHLDLLAGGADTNLPTESRELIELVYEASDRLILAFVDRSMPLPEVLAARFAVRILITSVPRTVTTRQGDAVPIGKALITQAEVACVKDYSPEGLHKNVAGMNPIRIRNAIQFAVGSISDGVLTEKDLYAKIRGFKEKTSANFEVPVVTFDQIGGYEDVKAELTRALELLSGAYALPDEALRHELIPRGFIFWGPPGTGKTLFAKAIANQLNATIQVVSGPEVMDMYVGESERKVRELFAEARRNAPAVLVFDEFDSIATRRDGRGDGGSRAGNAVVAQILTEMDGFRPDVPMLVIGTTNRIDIIDDALLRPSRFKAVQIGLPNLAARRAIAAIHARTFHIDVSPALLNVIASATDGFNGDDIQSLFRDACVGAYFGQQSFKPDAFHFGRLVGALRLAADQRTVGAVHTSTVRRDERPGANAPMRPLISVRSETGVATADLTSPDIQ